MKKLLFLTFLFSTASFAQQSLLQSGPMVGYSEMKEVMLWVQTKSPAKVKIEYWATETPAVKHSTKEVQTAEEKAYTAKLLADKVLPGKRYVYNLYINGKKCTFPYPTGFQSQVLWQWRTDPPAIKFAIGSCVYIGEPEYDRPGTPYGSEYWIFDSIAAKNPDFMLWLGDNTYLREVDWNSRTGIMQRNTHTRSIPELQKLLATTHHYAIWDDHDFGPNNSDRSYPYKKVTEEAFNMFWANPNTNLTGKGGITGTFQWADCEFFLMDDRYHRHPNHSSDPAKGMLGESQLEWLLDALTASQAPFKFVAIGNQVLHAKANSENMGNFPKEKERLLSEIEKRRIAGAIFLTGDKHHTELTMLPREGNYPLYDLTCSPLTSGTHSASDEGNTLQVPGTLVNDKNYGLLEVTGPRKDRVLKVSIYDNKNVLRWGREIKANDLRPPARGTKEE